VNHDGLGLGLGFRQIGTEPSGPSIELTSVMHDGVAVFTLPPVNHDDRNQSTLSTQYWPPAPCTAAASLS